MSKTRNEIGAKRAKAIGLIVVVAVILCTATFLHFRRLHRQEPEPAPAPTVSAEIHTDTPAPSTPPSFIDGPEWQQGEPIEDFEDTSFVADSSSGYRNDKRLIYQYNKQGDTVSVGLGTALHADRIYLAPQASITEQGHRVGFYITINGAAPIIYSQEWEPVDSQRNKSYSTFLIDRTYDSLVPAEYTDQENFGAAWTKDILDGSGEHEGCTIKLRVIDLDTRELLTTCSAFIKYDETTGAYCLDSIKGNDVLETRELTAEERTELLEWAYSVVTTEEYGFDGSVRAALLEYNNKQAVFEKSSVEFLGDTTYFNELCDTEKRQTKSARFLRKLARANPDGSNIVAVNLYIPTKGLVQEARAGLVTLYYAPNGVGAFVYAECQTDQADNAVKIIPPAYDNAPATSKNLFFEGFDYYAPLYADDKYFQERT